MYFQNVQPLPLAERVKLFGYCDTTADKLKLASSSGAMMRAAMVSTAFTVVDLSGLDENRQEHWTSITQLINHIGDQVKWLQFKDKSIYFSFFKYAQDPITAPFPHLEELRLDNIYTCFNLRFLEKDLEYLRRLTLKQVACPSREFVTHIPGIGRQLYELNISENRCLSKDDLMHIMPYCRRLTVLDVTNTAFLTPQAVGYILYHCTKIRKFFFSSRWNMYEAEDWVEVLENRFSHVKFSDETLDNLKEYKRQLRLDNGL